MSVFNGLEKVASFGKVYSSVAAKTLGVTKSLGKSNQSFGKVITTGGTTIKNPAAVTQAAKAPAAQAATQAKATVSKPITPAPIKTTQSKTPPPGMGHITNAYPGARKYIDI